MTSTNRPVSISNRFAERRKLRSICNHVIEGALKGGRLKQPGSMRNLRRWLMREVLKRERWSAGRERLVKAAAMILMLSGLFLSGVPAAQAAQATFTELTGAANPLDGVDVGTTAAPAFADIDADGDMDAFVGGFSGIVKYYENTGSVENPAFVERTGPLNPLDGFDVDGDSSVPTFVDIDADGDLDAFVGENSGTVKYFENIGSSISPTFVERIGIANPFDGVDVGSVAIPTFADIDSDGDLDAFVAEYDGLIHYFENTGSAGSALFVERTGVDNPFDGLITIFVFDASSPTFADIDSDGDLDAFVGEYYGGIYYYENTGSAGSPSFVERTGVANPFDGALVAGYAIPSFVDIDADGDMDAFVGDDTGIITFFENITVQPERNSVAKWGADHPLDIDIGGEYKPVFIDLDADGDLDAVIGELFGTIQYFQNTGSAENPVFTEQTGTANPFNGIDVGSSVAPAFSDIDSDGDLDAFIGNTTGNIKYFENIGSVEAPVFSEQTGLANPLDGVAEYSDATIGLVDIDADGDLDAFIGEYYGTVSFWENTGSAEAPSYTEQTDAANPLNISVWDGWYGYSAPTFADIDEDGDMDAIIGGYYASIFYYENTGSAESPAFTLRTGAASPLDGVNGAGRMVAPAPADLDADGDLDIMVGSSWGTFRYYRHNRHPEFTGTSTISGTAMVGNTLSLADTGTFDADHDTVTLSYQWQAGDLDIIGATLDTYDLTADELGTFITCIISADDGNGGLTAVTTSGVTVSETVVAVAGGGGGSLSWLVLLAGLIAPFRRFARTKEV